MLDKLEKVNTSVFPTDANGIPIEFYKGVGYFELKKYKEAEISFDKALFLTPNAPMILNNKAAVLYMQNEYMDAIKVLREMNRRFPLFVEPKINLLAIYANMKQDSLAQNLIQEIEKRSDGKMFIKNYKVFENIRNHYNEKTPN
jgi:tetratricopeptide (TPR) repeat protein